MAPGDPVQRRWNEVPVIKNIVQVIIIKKESERIVQIITQNEVALQTNSKDPR